MLAPTAEVIVGWNIPNAVFDAATNLRLVVWLHHGVDRLPLEAFRERGVAVSHALGVYDTPVGEHAMALLLACAKRLISSQRQFLDGKWTPLWENGELSVELRGKTLVLVGVGGIGGTIAPMAKAFGMHVIGIRRSTVKGKPPFVDELLGPDRLQDAASRADFLIVAVPLTATTHGIINSMVLEALPRTAYVINVSRAGIVDEYDLREALVSGAIAGYASDVWWDYASEFPSGQHYPVPSRLGIHKLDNVVATGSRGANVKEVEDRHLSFAVDAVSAYVRGEPIPNPVSFSDGY